MREVYVRRPRLHGKLSELVRCQVISENGETLRVMAAGARTISEVQKADIIPANKMSGVHDKMTLVPKMYPTASGAMHNRITKP